MATVGKKGRDLGGHDGNFMDQSGNRADCCTITKVPRWELDGICFFPQTKCREYDGLFFNYKEHLQAVVKMSNSMMEIYWHNIFGQTHWRKYGGTCRNVKSPKADLYWHNIFGQTQWW